MRRFPRWLTSVALVIGASAIAVPAASAATSVAYLDGHEVWVSSTDGAQKIRLSGGEGDWTAVAENDNGWIVGIQLEAGKIAQLSRFTVWNPQGAVAYRGPLASKPGASSYAFPLGLGLTADGRGLAYGFSAYTYGFPVGSLQTGYYFLPSETVVAPALGPLVMSAVEWVTLGPNDRAVGTSGSRQISVQRAGSLGETNFDPWFDLGGNPPTYEFNELDVSGDGNIVISEVSDNGAAAQDPGRILVAKFNGLGGTYVDDCFLDVPTDPAPRHGTVSADGSLIAWQDAAGIHLSGAPNLRSGGPSTCELTSGPTTIAASGSYPSLGGFDVGAYLAARAPAPAATPTPAPTPVATPAPISVIVPAGAAPKISSASSSATVKVTASATGAAKLTLTILPKALGLKGKTPIVLATGAGNVTAGKAASLKLKLTARGKSLKRKLKGKKATLTVTVGGSSTTLTIKLA